jgi:hypothetical protein
MAVGEDRPTTTYVVLHLTDGHPPSWVDVGHYTVPQGRSELAKRRAIAAVLKDKADVKQLTLVAVPLTSWNPEVYVPEEPSEPQWKPRPVEGDLPPAA